jgi:hypothetical protein
MNTIEDRLHAAARAVADTITADSVPPLDLSGQPGRPDRLSRKLPRRRRGFAVLAPIGAAAAVVAVIAASIGFSGGAQAPRPPSAASRAMLSGVLPPPYYMTCIFTQAVNGPKLPVDAVIRATATGKAVATVHLPAPYIYISAITGAANDRTFVLAAQTTKTFSDKGATAFFLARFDPADLKVSVMALRIPTEPGDQLDGLALSPYGTRLALAVTTGGPAAARTDDHILIYSLRTDKVTEWTGRGAIQFGSGSFGDPEAISWSATGKLAFNWITGWPSTNAIWVLNTATAGGSLLGRSKFVVRQQNDARRSFSADGILTLDGKRIVATTSRVFVINKKRTGTTPLPTVSFEVEEFSVATGRPVSVVYRKTNMLEVLFWADPSGRVLVVGVSGGPHKGFVVGTLIGGKFTPLRGAPSAVVLFGSLVF